MRELFARIWQRLNECAFDDLPVRETVLGLFLHRPSHPIPSEPSHCAAPATALIVCGLPGVCCEWPTAEPSPARRCIGVPLGFAGNGLAQ